MAGHAPRHGMDRILHLDTARFQYRDVLLRGGMLPHFSVHGWREQNWRARGQCDGGERVTRQPVCEFRDRVRRRGRDEKKVRAIGKSDVARPPVFFLVEETRRDWILRERLQRERRDEFNRVARHHDKNVMTLFHEQARQFRGFVGCDRTGHAEHDTFWFCCHVERSRDIPC